MKTPTEPTKAERERAAALDAKLTEHLLSEARAHGAAGPIALWGTWTTLTGVLAALGWDADELCGHVRNHVAHAQAQMPTKGSC